MCKVTLAFLRTLFHSVSRVVTGLVGESVETEAVRSSAISCAFG